MNVTFEYTDAALLFCLPEAGYDLSSWVERYTCFERTGVPSYQTVAGCVGRAVRAGAMPTPIEGTYRLSLEWYARTHRRDAAFSNSTDAMVEFAEELQGQQWPTLGPEYEVSVVEYERAAEHTRQYLVQLFRRFHGP